MTKATKKRGKKITAELKNIESKSPVEQMPNYFTIKLEDMTTRPRPEPTATKATKKLGKKIATELKNIESKSPVEQLTTYFTIGHMLREVMDGNESEYGQQAILTLVARVPDLKTDRYAYRLATLASLDESCREFMLEETAVLMNDGKYLTPTHWIWIFKHQPEGRPEKLDAWCRRELAWFRTESPSAAVLEHLEEILEGEYQRETDRFRDSVEDAIRDLQML